MFTILGAGGSIANQVVPLLAAQKKAFRLVSRSPHPAPAGAEVVRADLSDQEQTIGAVAGSSVVLLLAGLRYDHTVWAEMWPRIMANTIEATKRAGARLVFFDNVYMYGQVSGPMTEDTPFNPCSRKGEIRARVAATLLGAIVDRSLTAMIARAADFYGPNTPTGLPNKLVFGALSRKQRASWLADGRAPHSLTYTPDAARGLLMLAESPIAWNQTWHLPTAPDPPTGKEFIAMAARAMGVAPRYRVLRRPMVRVAGWFNPLAGEMVEMLYQNDRPYLFDSSRFAKTFGFSGTPYEEGIRETATWYSLQG